MSPAEKGDLGIQANLGGLQDPPTKSTIYMLKDE